MSSRRVIILIAAVLLGGLSAFAIYTYVGNVKTEVAQGTEMVPVWRVVETIPKGVSADQAMSAGLLAEGEVRADQLPPTAITPSEIQGLVAVVDIPANVPLVEGLFVYPSVVNTGITDRLKERGLVTFTFTAGEDQAAAYLIEPGDFINILVVGERVTGGNTVVTDDNGTVQSFDFGTETVAGAPEAATPTGQDDGVQTPEERLAAFYPNVARYVYQNVEVIAVGKQLTQDLGETEDETNAIAPTVGVYTVAVPPEAVQVLLAADPSRFYLSLVPENYEAVVASAAAFDVADLGGGELEYLYPGEVAEKLTPYWQLANQEQSTDPAANDDTTEASGDQ